MARVQTRSNAGPATGNLSVYKQKRRFKKTPEPGPKKKHSASGRTFVIQKHRASHLHYDLRLEVDGVLKSWAVPKGPSLNPKDKRLAMAVEDHPLDYAHFEGVIPEGEYGGGTVMVWDRGTYTPEAETSDVARAIAEGELKFSLQGTKLRGSWVLVRTRDRQWLLIKHRDSFASEESVTDTQATSVLSDRTLAEIAADEGGNVKKAATGDPETPARRKTKTQNSGKIRRKKKPASSAKPETAKRIDVPEGARAATMPKTVQPMLATLIDGPFSSDEWIYETKWDGVRTICYLDNREKGDGYRLVSRRQVDATAKYPELSKIASVISAGQAVLDGEIVALDKNGIPRFQLLQPRFGRKGGSAGYVRNESTLAYYVFDLLYLDGCDLTGVDLIYRKALLQSLIKKDSIVRYSDHVVRDGVAFFKEIQRLKLEGMIAKRSNSKYVQKRSTEWVKVKTVERSEVVIGGYTRPRGGRSYFGALVVGLYDRGRLKYVGHTGGGFNQASLKQLYDQMQGLKSDRSPFASRVKTNEAVQWVKPALACEVKFSEWTDDGIMRMPIFLGLRDDKDPKDCVVERKAPAEEVVEDKRARKARKSGSASRGKDRSPKPALAPVSILATGELTGDLTVKTPGGLVKLTNLDKIYWPGDGYTKGDLLKYYYRMARNVLPYVKDRPLILNRHPDGIEQPAFHQHTVHDSPGFVDTYTRDKDGEEITYAVANNLASLLYVANLGSISLHPWSARRTSPMKPDWILFDLDPGQAEFKQVLEVALLLKEQLTGLGLAGYPKTSGSKGLHVYVPIRNAYLHEQVVQFATLVARLTAREHGDLIAVERRVEKRKKNRVYLDYLQNGFGKSLAAPYSVRARAHATVSAPLDWGEIKEGKVEPADFTIDNMYERLERVGDLFKPVRTRRQSLATAVKRLEQLMKTPGTE